jgi:hypothetical protein
MRWAASLLCHLIRLHRLPSRDSLNLGRARDAESFGERFNIKGFRLMAHHKFQRKWWKYLVSEGSGIYTTVIGSAFNGQSKQRSEAR